jgi:hypothetical protein
MEPATDATRAHLGERRSLNPTGRKYMKIVASVEAGALEKTSSVDCSRKDTTRCPDSPATGVDSITGSGSPRR